MLAPTPAPTLTSADLKHNLHDIQDNVVAPILMRYGRHTFVKFNDGAKARTWLRNMFKRINARPQEHGTRFTVNIGFTYEGLKALGLSHRSLDSFPDAFRVGMRERAIGAPPIIFKRFPLPGENRDAALCNRGRGMILRRKNITARPAHARAKIAQRFNQNRGLHSHMQ